MKRDVRVLFLHGIRKGPQLDWVDALNDELTTAGRSPIKKDDVVAPDYSAVLRKGTYTEAPAPLTRPLPSDRREFVGRQATLQRSLGQREPQLLDDSRIGEASGDRVIQLLTSERNVDRRWKGGVEASRPQHPSPVRPDRYPVWVSAASPGSTHDITAARAFALPALYPAAAAGIPTLTDKGYQGAGIGIRHPRRLTTAAHVDDLARDKILTSLRATAERGNALLKLPPSTTPWCAANTRAPAARVMRRRI